MQALKPALGVPSPKATTSERHFRIHLAVVLPLGFLFHLRPQNSQHEIDGFGYLKLDFLDVLANWHIAVAD